VKLAIIAVGSVREKSFQEACADYRKRMTLMRPVDVFEVREETTEDGASTALIDKALEKEGARIVKLFRPDDFIVVLALDGTRLDSESFAKKIDPAAYPGKKRMVFVLGGSHGLASAIHTQSHWKLSFGPMTFPRQLAQVMLLEQLYRAQMISLGRVYHK